VSSSIVSGCAGSIAGLTDPDNAEILRSDASRFAIARRCRPPMPNCRAQIARFSGRLIGNPKNGTAASMPATARAQTRRILFGAAVLLSLGTGLLQSPGLFLTPVTRDLGLAATSFPLAIAIQNIVWGASQAPVGALADRFGLRITMLSGAAIYIVGLAVMAAAGGAASLIVAGALIGVALACTATSLVMTACARAVSEQRRSKVLGLVAGVVQILAGGPCDRRGRITAPRLADALD
jgi:MFS family permease